ncbi:hypothetical protein COT48_05425 [Candidatus Woesearchaeota archaeon CG08_land_8_20_14_0_20_47_9]|nr:MAG: hypothetical protein AUJ69_01990 [Candidatus Woesearchaeota archaeon CG1_02_47_18]PIN72961.1 MAG: hypothetical protein COV22_01805 [Candidatus Woesearchaeota archaeon CG10_big_fil_rev_8_21_14_0_10_47_5]PIO03339.1 MAG: hypothetical protein COT48_05425 [Candidatus Woesearchaeota archaeon CG08_land_8_20_14_0_20_47_9]
MNNPAEGIQSPLIPVVSGFSDNTRRQKTLNTEASRKGEAECIQGFQRKKKASMLRGRETSNLHFLFWG